MGQDRPAQAAREAEQLVESGTEVAVEPGAVAFREGEPADFWWPRPLRPAGRPGGPPQIDASRIEEYREAHRAVWPDLLRELQDAGRRNYSLFLRDDGLLIGYVESDDLDAAQDRVAGAEVNARWQAAMASLSGTDGAQDEAWQRIPEVSNLEDQLARLA